jgi:hypothetical protein
MARGFDSKSVADQQDEAQREKDRSASAAPLPSAQRRKLELARIDLVRRIDAAPEARRQELSTTLAALDELISKA